MRSNSARIQRRAAPMPARGRLTVSLSVWRVPKPASVRTSASIAVGGDGGGDVVEGLDLGRRGRARRPASPARAGRSDGPARRRAGRGRRARRGRRRRGRAGAWGATGWDRCQPTRSARSWTSGPVSPSPPRHGPFRALGRPCRTRSRYEHFPRTMKLFPKLHARVLRRPRSLYRRWASRSCARPTGRRRRRPNRRPSGPTRPPAVLATDLSRALGAALRDDPSAEAAEAAAATSRPRSTGPPSAAVPDAQAARATLAAGPPGRDWRCSSSRSGWRCCSGCGISRTLGRRLSRIAARAEAIGQGDLDARIGDTSSDEIGRLARTLDATAHALATSTVSRAHLDAVIESIPDPLCVLDGEGRVLRVNRAGADLVGAPGRRRSWAPRPSTSDRVASPTRPPRSGPRSRAATP